MEKSKQESNNAFISNDFAVAPNASGKLYRYPALNAYLSMIVLAICVIAPLISTSETRPISLDDYLIMFVFVTFGLTYIIYCLRYSVRIDETSMTIQGFRKKTFLLNDISEVRLRRVSRGAEHAFVKLANGKTIEIPSGIKGFSSLVEILQANVRQR